MFRYYDIKKPQICRLAEFVVVIRKSTAWWSCYGRFDFQLTTLACGFLSRYLLGCGLFFFEISLAASYARMWAGLRSFCFRSNAQSVRSSGFQACRLHAFGVI